MSHYAAAHVRSHAECLPEVLDSSSLCLLQRSRASSRTATQAKCRPGHENVCKHMKCSLRMIWLCLIIVYRYDLVRQFGQTPLHLACRQGHAGVADLLLSFSADMETTNDVIR